MTDLTLNIEKIISAPIEKVFDAWLNPKMLSKFMRRPDWPESDVENDPREGGSFTIIMHKGGEKFPHTSKYLKISRPNKLVFTWASHHSLDDSTVTLNFTKIDDNKTKISLTQVKFIDEEARSGHEEGWGIILDNLNKGMGVGPR
jgi:uncharacterized protein YndB with AHSA1/START domain